MLKSNPKHSLGHHRLEYTLSFSWTPGPWSTTPGPILPIPNSSEQCFIIESCFIPVAPQFQGGIQAKKLRKLERQTARTRRGQSNDHPVHRRKPKLLSTWIDLSSRLCSFFSCMNWFPDQSANSHEFEFQGVPKEWLLVPRIQRYYQRYCFQAVTSGQSDSPTRLYNDLYRSPLGTPWKS